MKKYTNLIKVILLPMVILFLLWIIDWSQWKQLLGGLVVCGLLAIYIHEFIKSLKELIKQLNLKQ